jgi:hypothetical protein
LEKDNGYNIATHFFRYFKAAYYRYEQKSNFLLLGAISFFSVANVLKTNVSGPSLAFYTIISHSNAIVFHKH